ncbi:MAG: SDR family NAD(P)-dependent oxidoreductase [Deltaproteobacteria bacterium]|jgi:short-subunit dehydrogenase|nr:SDR family NAD(P)-dependent oxidoreductase [Deltaproteobacteria bacterium]MBP6834114.1 SDR family NAD(P)-dependent oxidoreductase [Deltaproteobacteria bacterium]
MQNLSLTGKYTLVTGASSGLGLEMARIVARDHKGHLVLVARRLDRLEALATELREAHGVDVVCIQADMTRREDVVRTFEQATAGRAVHAAILNAGVTYFGRGLDHGFDDFDAMLATNVTSVVWLTQRFAQHILSDSPGGGVMIVSSVAGTTATPYQAAYSGTKAFLNNFGLALGEELVGEPVSVTVFVPGGIATEMGEKSGTARKFKKGDVGMMDADVCARRAVRGLTRRERFVIPGALNVLNDLVLRFTPRGLASAMAARLYRDALPPKT